MVLKEPNLNLQNGKESIHLEHFLQKNDTIKSKKAQGDPFHKQLIQHRETDVVRI